jgi:hypothetical protein
MAEAKKRFGDNPRHWRFVCPVCKTEQGFAEFEKRTDIEKAELDSVLGFSCIGRWARGGVADKGLMGDSKVSNAPDAIGCNYAGGGLFKLNPTVVTWDGSEHRMFAFAEPLADDKDAA